MVKPSVLKDPPNKMFGVFQQAKVTMTQFKTSYKSVAMIVTSTIDKNGEEKLVQVKYDLKKATEFVKNHEILVAGSWCPLFVLPTSKTTGAIGVQIRGVTLEGSDTRIVEPLVAAPKVAAPLADPFAEFAGVDESDEAIDAQLDAALGN